MIANILFCKGKGEQKQLKQVISQQHFDIKMPANISLGFL